MKKIVVYSSPNCMQCRFVKKFFHDWGVEIVEKDVVADPQALAEIKSLGFSSVPVTFVDGHAPIVGYAIDKLAAILSQDLKEVRND